MVSDSNKEESTTTTDSEPEAHTSQRGPKTRRLRKKKGSFVARAVRAKLLERLERERETSALGH